MNTLATKVYLIEKKAAHNNGFCASGAEGKNISICAAIISSSGRPIAISKGTNNQLFYPTLGRRFGQTGILISHLRKAMDVGCHLTRYFLERSKEITLKLNIENNSINGYLT